MQSTKKVLPFEDIIKEIGFSLPSIPYLPAKINMDVSTSSLISLLDGNRTKARARKVEREIESWEGIINSQQHQPNSQTHLSHDDHNERENYISSEASKTIARVFSIYGSVRQYEPLTIIEATGSKRSTVKLLIEGKVIGIKPINSTVWNKCASKYRQNNSEDSQDQENNTLLDVNPENGIEGFQKSITLSPKSPEQILMASQEIIQHLLTITLGYTQRLYPHTPMPALTKQGQLLADQNQALIPPTLKVPVFKINSRSRCTFISATSCILFEIPWKVYFKIDQLFSNDKERILIKAALAGFGGALDYWGAEKLISWKQSPVVQEDVQVNEQENEQTKPINVQQTAHQTEALIIDRRHTYNSQEEAESKWYEIDSEWCLIVEGSVKVVLTSQLERKWAPSQHSAAEGLTKQQDLLVLSRPDIFGMEVQECPQLNLKYKVRGDSRLVRIPQWILKSLGKSYPQLTDYIQMLKIQRKNRIMTQASLVQSSLLSPRSLPPKINLKRDNGYQTIGPYPQQSIVLTTGSVYKLSEFTLSPSKKQLNLKQARTSGLNTQFSGRTLQGDTSARQYSFGSNMIEIRLKNSHKLLKRVLAPSSSDIQGNHSPKKQTSPVKLESHSYAPATSTYLSVGTSTNKLPTLPSVQLSASPKPLLQRLGLLSYQQITKSDSLTLKAKGSDFKPKEVNQFANQMAKMRQKAQSLPKLSKCMAKCTKLWALSEGKSSEIKFWGI